MSLFDQVIKTRRTLQDVALPLEVARRYEKEGAVAFMRSLIRTLDARHRDITRVVNTNALFAPEIVVDVDDGPAYAANWLNLASHHPLTFWLVPWGDVHLTGNFDRSPRTPSAPETIFTLPLGFRPANELEAVAHETTTGTGNPFQVDIQTDGQVVWRGGNMAAPLYINAVFRAVAVS